MKALGVAERVVGVGGDGGKKGAETGPISRFERCNRLGALIKGAKSAINIYSRAIILGPCRDCIHRPLAWTLGLMLLLSTS